MATDYYHGVRTRQIETSVSTPVTAGSGITFAVGTAPVQMCGGTVPEGGGPPVYQNVNEPVMGMSYAEAVTALGYSEDWKKYTLCEVMYSHYKLYATAPVFFVNVLDPAKHKTPVAETPYPLVDGRVRLPLDAIRESVAVTGYTEGQDYDLFYDGENLVVAVLPESTIPGTATELSIAYHKVDPAQVTKDDIIGGFDVVSQKTTGLELIDAVFPKYGIAPDILICPGFSHNGEVAAVMGAKATGINGVFEAHCLIDVDTDAVRHYGDVVAWKKDRNINGKKQVLCFPMCKLDDRVFHLSTQMAGLMATVDTDNGGCPAESPSNTSMQISGAVLADGTEVLLDLQSANYLNSNGVTTVLNFIGSFVLWGNETACFPGNTDVKDTFLCVSRMFGWVSNSLILTYWSRIDSKFSRRFIDNILDSVNIWLNGLVSEEKLLGGRVEFLENENPVTALANGKAAFHLSLAPLSPAKEIEFVLEYDLSYITAALSA